MITSLQNETIKEIVKLKQKKYRDEKKMFLIEGFHLIEEARKSILFFRLLQRYLMTLKKKHCMFLKML